MSQLQCEIVNDWPEGQQCPRPGKLYIVACVHEHVNQSILCDEDATEPGWTCGHCDERGYSGVPVTITPKEAAPHAHHQP